MCIYEADGPGRGSIFLNKHKNQICFQYSLDFAIFILFILDREEFKRYPENFNEVVLESFTKTIHGCVACE